MVNTVIHFVDNSSFLGDTFNRAVKYNKFRTLKQNLYNTIIDGRMTPTLLKQIVYFSPGYDSVTWWRHQRIKTYNRSPLIKSYRLIDFKQAE